MLTHDPFERFLSIAEAARRSAVHPSTVRRWIDAGLLPAYRVGRRRLGVRQQDLAGMVRPRQPNSGQPGLQDRGLEALDRLERRGAALAARTSAPAPEAWEIINASRNERARQWKRPGKA
jgi:excisionase family DNA binding protein